VATFFHHIARHSKNHGSRGFVVLDSNPDILAPRHISFDTVLLTNGEEVFHVVYVLAFDDKIVHICDVKHLFSIIRQQHRIEADMAGCK